MTGLLIQSTWETLLMVVISTLAGIAIGLPLGVFLFVTDKMGLFQHFLLNRTIGFIVNAVRSIPYIILVVAIVPLTRLIAGSSIGTAAATVPLSIAAIMLYCRIVEDALRQTPKGLIEAALSMGATRMQVITKVLIPESLPNMISGLTFVVISLVGFSAMAGAVGGGGLGALGIQYGYQRYNVVVIAEVVIILIVMVQIIQSTGTYFAKKLKK